MTRFTKKKKIAIVTAALVIGVSGTAYAYWTQLGAGTGGATTGTTAGVVVNQTGTAIVGLYPDGPAKALSGTFNNSNDGPVTVKAVTATVTGTSVEGCQATWYAIGGADTLTTHVLPVGAGVGTWSGLNVSLTNNLTVNQDACKNATIVITYALAA